MSQSAARLFSSAWFRLGIGIGISLITLYLAFQQVPLANLSQILALVNPGWIVLAFVSVGSNTFFKAVRWKAILAEPGQNVPLSQVLLSFLAGSLLNWVYPARIGDLSRAFVAGDRGPGKVFVLGTIALEKIFDTICYALLIFLLLLIIPLPDWLKDPGRVLAVVSLLMIILMIALVSRRAWLVKAAGWLAHRGPGWIPQQLRSRATGYLQSGLSSLNVLQTGWRVWIIVLWSILIWVTAFTTTFLVVQSLPIPFTGWSQRLTASLLTLVTLQAGISIPSVPGRFGVFELACVLALGYFGIEQVLASGFGLLLHGVVLIPAVIAGAFAIIALGSSFKRSPGGW